MTVTSGPRKLMSNQRSTSIDRELVARIAQEFLMRERRSRMQASQMALKPRMDVYDDPELTTVSATIELPGMQKEDVALQLQDSRLTISGERRCALAPGGVLPSAKFRIQEVKYGKLHRVIPLPEGTQANAINASMVDGMLTITWPRQSTTTDPSRRIAVD